MVEEELSQLCLSLPHFDGPFDLLLSLIRRNRYPVDALPVLEITGQFLTYVKNARDLDADLGGEFIEVASWLVLLKSRSLLPASNDTQPSPREELRRAILDHQTLHAATEILRERDGNARPASAGAPASSGEALVEFGEQAPSVQDVLEAARRAMETARAAAALENSEGDMVSVEDQIRWIARQFAALPIHTVVSTDSWFAAQPYLAVRAALLLALLELARKQFILIQQHGPFTSLLVKAISVIPENVLGGEGADVPESS